VITKKTITSAVAAGWISFPEPKERQLSRSWAQSVEAFDSELAWRMWDNGASREQIARAIGCSRRGVEAGVGHGRNSKGPTNQSTTEEPHFLTKHIRSMTAE